MKNIIYFFLLFHIGLSFAQSDSMFVDIKDIDPTILIDLKYATQDNFLKEAVYDCAKCYLRKSTAQALSDANKFFMERGYRIKVFDCYRPHDVQKKMWKIVPNPNYVANPASGSVHNRGGAVDLTLVDLNGDELDMGTPFDFFGPQAGHYYQNLPPQVKANRTLLRDGLRKYGFLQMITEWWHYNHLKALREKVSNFKWDCP